MNYHVGDKIEFERKDIRYRALVLKIDSDTAYLNIYAMKNIKYNGPWRYMGVNTETPIPIKQIINPIITIE